MTVIVRGKISKNNEWTEQQVLFRAPPELYSSTNAHYGSRFIFDKQGHLFFTLGEKNNMAHAQDLVDPLGKIHRVNDDGTVPKDNPFVESARTRCPSIWSYGHRNPQGLAWDPVTGKLWESEHGPTGRRRDQHHRAGHNYGWGVITHGHPARHHQARRRGHGAAGRLLHADDRAERHRRSTRAPSIRAGRTTCSSAALAGQQLRRLEIAGDKVTHQEVLFNQFGRIRDVVMGPDGYLYVTMQLPGQSLSQSTPGMVARLVPVQ